MSSGRTPFWCEPVQNLSPQDWGLWKETQRMKISLVGWLTSLWDSLFYHAPSQRPTGLPGPPAPAEIPSTSAITRSHPTSQAQRLIPPPLPSRSLAGESCGSGGGGQVDTGMVEPRVFQDFPSLWSFPSCKGISCSGMAFDPWPLFPR